MLYAFYDWTIWLVVLGSVLGLIAQGYIQSTFRKYSRVPTRMGRTGAEVASGLLAQSRCYDTRIAAGGQTLSDHFDPRNNTVSLSRGVYDSSSVSAVSVAAHECGHVMQHEQGYVPIRIRTALVPLANLGGQLSMPLLLAGFLFSWTPLLNLGIWFFGLAVLFQLVTLPVEINASHRALSALQSGGYLTGDEQRGARKVLFAAAMTYVAAALASVLQLLRLMLLFGNRRDR